MQNIYFDNASTSFPKAPGLGNAIASYIDNRAFNISRGNYVGAYGVEGEVIRARELLREFFACDKAANVVFTPGATASLNMILKGLLLQGDHVLTSSMEHNAVVRPLTQIAPLGVEWEEVPCSETGELDPAEIRRRIKKNTKLVLLTHASNVCGTLLPMEEVGRICKEKGVFFAVDAAQTAGSLPIDCRRWNVDALAFPAHKGILGPQGIGGLIVNDKVSKEMIPLLAGGTGSRSDSEEMPGFLPDKFQAGTLNLPGIVGISHALAFIQQEGLEAIQAKKALVTQRFLAGALNLKGARLVGIPSLAGRCGVVSLDFAHCDNAEISFLLERDFGVMTRCGLHCAPHAHRTLDTYPQGTVRFSFGFFNEPKEVDAVLSALYALTKGAR